MFSLGGQGKSVYAELKHFFGTDPLTLPIVSRSFPVIDLPNLNLGIEHAVGRMGATSTPVGFVKMVMFSNSLRELLVDRGHDPSIVGPVQYRDVEIAPGEFMPCIEDAIILIRGPSTKLAALVRRDMMHGHLALEILAATKSAATELLRLISEGMAKSNVYQGRIISMEADETPQGGCSVPVIRFHQLPEVRREHIILPAKTIEILERNTIGFFEHAGELVKSGRSAKRGLLLYGKPGTGKTFTARWLAQSVPGATVLLMSGEQLWLIKECCKIARMLAPSIVIMEDVDLIAMARDESRHPEYQVTLHMLLNEMDGVDPQNAVLFLLTTNRPGAIEPAIASRPGRIDQAIEYPLPDSECRRRLMDLYGSGLDVCLEDVEAVVARTEGASPAFIQEMLRKAALFAAEEGSYSDDVLRVTDSHMHSAIEELLFSAGGLTKNLLGFDA